MPSAPDHALAQAAAAGDPHAWNAIVQRLGPTLLAETMAWCEAGCRMPRGRYGCMVRTLQAQLPEPGEDRELCRETRRLYEWAAAGLKPRLAELGEGESLEAWAKATLPALHAAYLGAELGRLEVPPPLADAPPATRDAWRLACRVGDRGDVAARLGLDDAGLSAAQADAQARLAAAGHPAADPLPEAPPAWLNRAVLDHSASDAPEPEAAAADIKRKLWSQPDWLAGLALGGAVSALLLVVVLPRQEYARPVKSPEDRQIAAATSPLAPELAARLADAREQLAKGKIDAAIQGLDAVLAARPEHLEARWLLASTYDRLGDQARAAKHYQAFLSTHTRVREVEDERAARARARLGDWSGTP